MKNSKISLYGDGKNVRDWLYVIDHCYALITVLEKGHIGETYNIGGNSERENIQIVHQLCDLLDQRLGRTSGASRQLINFVGDRPGHDRRDAVDATKIRNELEWEPEYQFEEALAFTVDWYMENMPWVNYIWSEEYLNWIEKNYELRN